MKPEYVYLAKVVKVIDGDTIDCLVDLGFNTFIKERFRLYGIDTPEKNSKIQTIKDIAINAYLFVKDTTEGKDVLIESTGKDKYGRWLAKVYASKDIPTVNEQLITLGFAKAYFGDNKLNLGWETTI
jgi:micrococcal nuclease